MDSHSCLEIGLEVDATSVRGEIPVGQLVSLLVVVTERDKSKDLLAPFLFDSQTIREQYPKNQTDKLTNWYLIQGIRQLKLYIIYNL